jgi:hypothetical protein
MVLAMVEADRAVLLRRLGVESGTARDPIPPARWLLAPLRTALLWRRMVLWQVVSYRTAVETELAVRRTAALLRLRFGRRWRRRAPGDLAWMLRVGVDIEAACSRVAELIASPKDEIGTTEHTVDSETDAARTAIVAARSPRLRLQNDRNSMRNGSPRRTASTENTGRRPVDQSRPKHCASACTWVPFRPAQEDSVAGVQEEPRSSGCCANFAMLPVNTISYRCASHRT